MSLFCHWFTSLLFLMPLHTEYDPHKQCEEQILDQVLISLSVAAFTVILFLFTGALILRCRRVGTNQTLFHRHEKAMGI